MKANATILTSSRQVARIVRERIELGGERLWSLEDFQDQPVMAAAQALSRLSKAGIIERLSKGTYYRARATVFGQSRPNPTTIQKLASHNKSLFPAGIVAANLLGFTTQTVKHNELATCASSLPRKLVGQETVIHTRRPEAWATLTETEAAMLDFLRRGGSNSELTPLETVEKMLVLFAESNRYQHLIRVASTEPPRVRALLGAFGQQLNVDEQTLKTLRQSLNPLSRFDFGMFSVMPNAKAWFAKEYH